LYDQKIIRDEMDIVDNFIVLEINRRGLNGKTESYKEVLSDLSKKLQLPKTISPEEKVKKLSTLLKSALETLKKYKKLGIDLPSLEQMSEDKWQPLT